MNKNFIYKLFLIIFIFSLIFINQSGIISATVRIEPARIIINALDNTRSTGMIEVINNGEEEIELTAILNDWALDERDALVVFDAGETDYTLENLIKFNPKKFTLAPGKKQIVRFTVAPPRNLNISKERRGVVFFEREMDYIDAATGSRVKSQIGTVIYYIPKDVVYKFNFLGLRVYKTIPELPQWILLNIRNDGDAHLRYFPSYKVVNSKNEVIMEASFDQFLILPKNERQFSFYLEERLPVGEYKILLTFNFYNNDQVAEYQVPIKIE